MSRSAALGALCYATESSWGEDSTTFGTRLPVQSRIDASGLVQSLIPTERTVQLLNGGTFEAIGPMGGSFRTRFHLAGHGTTTSGATAATSLPTLLGYAIGGGPGTPAAGSTFTGGTATAPTTTASATFTAGQLCRGGAFGDAKAAGRWAAIASHITTTMTLLTAFAAAPTNGDVLYSAETVYTSELPSSSAITGLRFLLQTANMEYECHGCWARSVSITMPVNGELPSVEIEWGVSWWRHSTATFPSATSVEAFTPAISGGAQSSFFFNAYGTATHAVRTIRALSIDIGVNNVPVIGPGGVNQYQTITGCVRTPADITVGWVEDATTATASPQSATDFAATTASHALWTSNTTAGQSMGLYMPNLIPTGNNGVQFDDGGINRVRRQYKARADETRATDLLASALRIGFA